MTGNGRVGFTFCSVAVRLPCNVSKELAGSFSIPQSFKLPASNGMVYYIPGPLRGSYIPSLGSTHVPSRYLDP